MIIVYENCHFTFLTVYSIPRELPYYQAKMIMKSFYKVQSLVCSNYKVQIVFFQQKIWEAFYNKQI